MIFMIIWYFHHVLIAKSLSYKLSGRTYSPLVQSSLYLLSPTTTFFSQGSVSSQFNRSQICKVRVFAQRWSAIGRQHRSVSHVEGKQGTACRQVLAAFVQLKFHAIRTTIIFLVRPWPLFIPFFFYFYFSLCLSLTSLFLLLQTPSPPPTEDNLSDDTSAPASPAAAADRSRCFVLIRQFGGEHNNFAPNPARLILTCPGLPACLPGAKGYTASLTPSLPLTIPHSLPPASLLALLLHYLRLSLPSFPTLVRSLLFPLPPFPPSSFTITFDCPFLPSLPFPYLPSLPSSPPSSPLSSYTLRPTASSSLLLPTLTPFSSSSFNLLFAVLTPSLSL